MGIGALVLAAPTAFTGWAELTAEVSPSKLVYHYVTGNGEPVHLNFKDLDLSGIEESAHFPNLQQMATRMKKQGIESQDINLGFGYVMNKGDEFSVGGIKVRLKGQLVINSSHWELKNGEITGEPDLFSYDEAEHRSVMGNFTTWIGREALPGTPFMVIFDNSHPYHAEGSL